MSTEKKLTAMQELIQLFETFKGMCQTDGEKFIIKYAINSAKSKLEKEKQQIIDARIDGVSKSLSIPKTFAEKKSEQYYEQTFKN